MTAADHANDGRCEDHRFSEKAPYWCERCVTAADHANTGDALIKECESHAAVLSMTPTPFQLEQSVNFLVSTVPHVIRALAAQAEAALDREAGTSDALDDMRRRAETAESERDRAVTVIRSEHAAKAIIGGVPCICEWCSS